MSKPASRPSITITDRLIILLQITADASPGWLAAYRLGVYNENNIITMLPLTLPAYAWSANDVAQADMIDTVFADPF